MTVATCLGGLYFRDPDLSSVAFLDCLFFMTCLSLLCCACVRHWCLAMWFVADSREVCFGLRCVGEPFCNRFVVLCCCSRSHVVEGWTRWGWLLGFWRCRGATVMIALASRASGAVIGAMLPEGEADLGLGNCRMMTSLRQEVEAAVR